jgi:hypothetical protein
MPATSSEITMLLTIDIQAICLISTAAKLAPSIIVTIKQTFVLYDNVYL